MFPHLLEQGELAVVNEIDNVSLADQFLDVAVLDSRLDLVLQA